MADAPGRGTAGTTRAGGETPTGSTVQSRTPEHFDKRVNAEQFDSPAYEVSARWEVIIVRPI